MNYFTGFCVEGHTHAIRKKDQARRKRNNALWVAEQLGIKLHIIDVVDEYRDIVLNPRHGYGANLNPCLDCKIFMVGKTLAANLIDAGGFDFVITGEVVGQRPKSQRADTMPLIARESGAGDRLLRPLTALNLPPTLPSAKAGWIAAGSTASTPRPQAANGAGGIARLCGLRPAGWRLLLPHQREVRRQAGRSVERPGGGATTTSTTSCCSRWAGTFVRRRTTS